MKRRNFFALLLAPFVARFLPKGILQKPLSPETAAPIIVPNTVGTFNMVTTYTGDTIQYYWHGPDGLYELWPKAKNISQQLPFVVMPPIENPWETSA